MGLRVGAVIVTYNCCEKVVPTFRSVLPQVERIIFVDNGSCDRTLAVIEGLCNESPEKAETIALKENEGIARALNIGMQRAVALDFPWVLTMDHDSVADPQMVEFLADAVAKYPKPGNVAISAPVYMDSGDKSMGRLYRYDRWKRSRLDPEGSARILEPTVVITSGNLVNTKLHARLGGFDESLVIDYVDHDYCLRAREAGLSVIVSADARLSHSVGNATSVRLFGLSWFSTDHPASRRYTIGRNRMTMIRRYWRCFPAYSFWTAIGFGLDFVGILLCEDGKRDKVTMMVRGAWDSWKVGSTK